MAAVEDAGVRLIGLNFFAGDLFGPDCGVLSIPDRVDQFRANVDVAVGIGERLGVGAFNALYGNRVDDASADEQDELAAENLAIAARAAKRVEGTVLVDPVGGAGGLRPDAIEIDVLLRVSVNQVVIMMAGDCENRSAIELRIVETVHQMDSAGPGSGEANA